MKQAFGKLQTNRLSTKIILMVEVVLVLSAFSVLPVFSAVPSCSKCLMMIGLYHIVFRFSIFFIGFFR